MNAPGTWLGARISESPGYGLVQSCASYQENRFICSTGAESARARLPVKCCLAFHACHLAAVSVWAAGTVADGGAAKALFCGAGLSEPQEGWVARPRVSEVRLGTTLNGVLSGLVLNAARIGAAALSFWFIGWIPRICSMVRII